MQRTKVAFYLYLVENGINVALAVALVHPLGVRGLALSLSVAYSVGALLGVARVAPVVRAASGRPHTWDPLRRVGVATVAMGVVVLVVSNLSGATRAHSSAGWLGSWWPGSSPCWPVAVTYGMGAPAPCSGRRSRHQGPAYGPDGVADSPHARRADRDRQRL